MEKKIKLTQKELDESTKKIAEKSFKYFKKMVVDELEYRLKVNGADTVDVATLFLTSLSSLDANALMMTRETLKRLTGNEIDIALLMASHFAALSSILDENELARLREKMN